MRIALKIYYAILLIFERKNKLFQTICAVLHEYKLKLLKGRTNIYVKKFKIYQLLKYF